MAPPSALLGHEDALGRLEAALAEGALPHALLLSGPAGLGKTTLALRVADEALGGAAWPGGLLAHPDLWLEDSDAERVGIDRIRAGARADAGPSLQDVMSLRTYAGGMRVAILARAERLTEQAADALLKTLEEPPPGTVILLCAANPEALPATILSRAQHVSLAAVPVGRITGWLEAQAVEPRLARLAAGLSAGRPGRALRLATEPGALAAEIEALHAFLAIAGGGLDGALRAASELTPAARARRAGNGRSSCWRCGRRTCVTPRSRPPASRSSGCGPTTPTRWNAGRRASARTASPTSSAPCCAPAAEIAQYTQPRLTFETLFLDIFAGPEPPPPVEAPAVPAAVADAPDAATAPRAPTEPAARRPARRR